MICTYIARLFTIYCTVIFIMHYCTYAYGIEGCANNGVFLDISDIARDCIMYTYENSAINR